MDRYVNSCLCGSVGGPYEAVLIFHPALESTWATFVCFLVRFRLHRQTKSILEFLRRQAYVRGAHIMFCNLDELITSLLCFLHYIIDQFRNTCDKKYFIPYSHFHSMREYVRQGKDLLPAVLTCREGIFEVLCIMTSARKNPFKSAFKV